MFRNMFRPIIRKRSWCQLQKRYVYNKEANEGSSNQRPTKIRNIGILAHIDAGKTTTTERMLYYAGFIHNMGEVHHGNTVTDYMEQERQRGITITSAAVTFNWKNYKFNLIDTPGHIDFTMGVEQSLRVLDGAVVILDGSAGVEAQTLTVCRQADRYGIPRIIYVNKMDRPDANFEMSLNSVEKKLNAIALPVQFPIKRGDTLEGIVDIIRLNKIMFGKKDQGMSIMQSKLLEMEDMYLWESANEKRKVLIDKLSGLDDRLANIIIEQESFDKIPEQELVDAVRRITIARKGIPILIGSSYKNIGVQPLMDSVILYLPSPELNQYAKQYNCFRHDLSARAFKVIHDKQKGPITFFRIYSGSMKKDEKLYNVQRNKTEQIEHLYIICADNYKEIADISYGNIAAVTGLKSTIAGDLLTTSESAMKRAKKSILNEKCMDPKNVENLFASDVNVPDPVFFCSIEPPSLSKQAALETALQELQKEDPSLRVTQDDETGQTVLSGMGELHIEIIKERIRTEYNIDADLGPLLVAYQETMLDPIKDTYASEHRIGKTRHSVVTTMSLIPNYEGKEMLLFDRTPDCASNIDSINKITMQAIKKGVKASLLHGPILNYPIVKVGVKLHWLEVKPGTSVTMITAAVSQCIKKEGNSVLLEPMMNLEVVTNEKYSSSVLSDLMQRRATIRHIEIRGSNKIIVAFTPLSELCGYSTTLRIMTSGNSTLFLEFSHYQIMTPSDEREAVKRITGF